eukprot:TRINITY_DN2920_c0_g1_i1.p1 TRINITY_DN2920_c0_g1~~TRINITY_DN2920_c0_g1_i1.p1  ORF type:complete len:281 (+),score=16.15 TRINITY_DN2920_c0_g1_i1:161-1003(+)
MKYLQVPALAHLSTCLSEIDTGDSIVTGRLEAYSCKTAGDDKKLYKSLNKVLTFFFCPLGFFSNCEPLIVCQPALRNPCPFARHSTRHESLSIWYAKKKVNWQAIYIKVTWNLHSVYLGPLALSTSRRTFISLVCTLNASFPDYDFSSVKPEQFKREPSLHMVVNYINTVLGPVMPMDPLFTAKMWHAVDQQISLRDCDVYGYLDSDDDSFGDNIWALNYFFYNKRQRCLIFLTCRCISKSMYQQEATMKTGSESEEEEINGGWAWSVDDQIAAEMEMEC